MPDGFACNLCGGRDAEPLYQTRDRRFDLPGSFAIVRCASCGLAAVHPRPDPATLARHYPAAYYTHAAPRLTVKDRWEQRRRALAFGLHAGASVGRPRGGLAAAGRSLLPGQGALKAVATQHGFDVLVPQAGQRFLEIGFGGGLFLDFLARRGFVTSGVETDPVTVANARARGHDVRPGRVEDAGFLPASFDHVRMRHVLEHLPDPAGTLAEVHRILKPGGHLFVEVPNFGSVYSLAFGERWAQLEAPRHLHHFTPATLRRLVQNSGFTVRRITFDTQPWHLLTSLAHAAADAGAESGPAGTPGLTTGGRVSAGLHRLSQAVSAAGLGDNIILMAAKPGDAGRSAADGDPPDGAGGSAAGGTAPDGRR